MSRIEHYASRLAPNVAPINAIFIARHFNRVFGRRPRPPQDPEADYHDFLVDRMSRGGWSSTQLRCVDKEFAKLEASKLHPAIKAAETVAVIPIRGMSIDRFTEAMGPHLGRHFVAKPTHGSAATEFLDARPDLTKLYRAGRYNYFYSFRESQYAPLERKIIIEENIAEHGSDLRDFKFFCSFGRILFVQVDANRFIEHERILLSPPDFEPLNLTLGAFKPTTTWVRPKQFEALCHAAQDLSRPFDFVRVDLYEQAGQVFFGEFTFTPGAGMEPFSEPGFSRRLLSEIKARPDCPAR